MPFTALRTASNRTRSPEYGPVQNKDVSPSNLHRANAQQSIYAMWQGASVTIIAMIVPYIIGFCIATAHLVLYTYLNHKRIDIDTSFPQSWVSAIALVFVNTFRLAICFSLGVVFTQLLSRRIRTSSMPLGDYDRLQRLQTNLDAWLHPSTLCVVPAMTIAAVLGWLVTIAMVLPPGSLTVLGKEFSSETEEMIPTFNSSFTGNGSFASAAEYMLAKDIQWNYMYTIPPMLATAKGALISGDVVASASPCGTNCNYTLSFHGPLAKCNTTTLNESIHIDFPDKDAFYAVPAYSGGWTTANSSRASNSSSDTLGWITADGTPITSSCDDFNFPDTACTVKLNRPDTFSFSQYTLSPPLQEPDFDGRVVTYQRSTRKTSCMLHRGEYTLRTEYSSGERILNISTSAKETLEVLWKVDHNKPHMLIGWDDHIPINMSATYEVMNIFALFNSLVESLSGEYYDGHVISIRTDDRAMLYSQTTPPFIGGNQTIIADSVFNNRIRPNKTGYDTGLFSFRLDLDLSEERINEALKNITLSTMYAFDWWHTTTNVTRTTNHNIFSFSSHPRLIVPYTASLLLTFPFLFLGLRALQLNGASGINTSFLQTLVTTTGSARLREIAATGSEKPHDVPESVKETRIRFGYMLEMNGEEVVRRSTFGLEDEVESMRFGEGGDGR